MTKTIVSRLTLYDVSKSLLVDASSPYWAPSDAVLFAAQQGKQWFTTELVDALKVLQLATGPAALHLTGIPVWPTEAPTPEQTSPPLKADEWSNEACLLGLASFLGLPYGYVREHSGAIIQQVVPVPNKAGVASSEGTGELAFHTENSFASTRPDFVLLLCRRPGPSRAPTCVLDVEELCSMISPETVQVLAERIYRISSPPSFGEPQLGSGDVSVLDVVGGGRTALRLDLEGLLTSASREGKEALDELFAVLPSAGTPVDLEGGDVLIIDNRRAAHARPSFSVVFDGRQRWLQRCLVRSEFWTCRAQVEGEGVVVL